MTRVMNGYGLNDILSGHLQTLFTAAGDFTKVDKVHYVRSVKSRALIQPYAVLTVIFSTYLRLPDGGTL